MATDRGSSARVQEVLGEHGVLDAGEREAAGVAADGDDHRVGRDPPPGVRQLQGVGADEAGPALGDQPHAHPVEALSDRLGDHDLVDHLLDLDLEAVPVDRGRTGIDAVLAAATHITQQPGGLGQDAGGDAAGVDTGAAQRAVLQHHRAPSQLGRPHRRHQPGRPRADHGDLVVEAQPGHGCSLASATALKAVRLVLQPDLLFASLVVCAAGAGLVAASPS